MAMNATWLASAYQGLQNFVPSHVNATKRSSVAIIIRTNHPDALSIAQNQTPKHTIDIGLQHLQVEILYIKRAMRQNDKWSGHVAFPGGMRQGNETPIETAIRETREEIGLHLDDEKHFQMIGRLNDQIVLYNADQPSLVVSSFVFLQKSDVTPECQLDPKEVSSITWAPINIFLQANEEVLKEHHFHLPVPQSSKLGFTKFIFPGLILPHTETNDHYHLWGLTYRITVGLFKIANSHAKRKGWGSLKLAIPLYEVKTGNKVIDSVHTHYKSMLTISCCLLVGITIYIYPKFSSSL